MFRLRALLPLLFFPLLAFSQENTLRDLLDNFVQTQTRNLPGQVAYTISPVGTVRACEIFEPFVPPGNRLWGKSMVGVRCLSPSSWTVYLQVHVSVHGNYLVATRNLPTGTLVSSGDLTIRAGELTVLPFGILTDPAQAIGKMVKTGLPAGQFFRGDGLITPWAVQQGQMVKLLSRGPGFSVSSEGKAQGNANEGQIVQIRTSSGQIVSGIARSGGVVEVTH